MPKSTSPTVFRYAGSAGDCARRMQGRGCGWCKQRMPCSRLWWPSQAKGGLKDAPVREMHAELQTPVGI